MTELTAFESRALEAVLVGLIPEFERLGWDRSFAQMSKLEIMSILAEAIRIFRVEMSALALEDEIPF